MARDTQLFHLPLNEITNNSFANIGGLNAGAIAHGNPIIQIDPEMGACLKFDGIDDYVELTNLSSFDFKDGMSFTAWVRFDKNRYYYDLLNFSTAQGDRFRLGGNAGQDFEVQSAFNGLSSSSEPSPINTGAWNHVALIYDYLQGITVFFNGKKVTSTDKFDRTNGKQWLSAFLGKTAGNQGALFYGAMANVRIYNCAITTDTLNTVMNADKNSNANTTIKVTEADDASENSDYSGTSPLKIDLYTVRDNDQLPILYIESDNKSEPLELKLANTGNKPIQFGAVNTPGENDFQVQLRFRRNVISPNLLNALQTANTKEIGDWQYAIGISGDLAQDYISFAKKSSDFTLESHKKLVIQIPGFSASAEAGARNTKVEVRYRNDLQNPGSAPRHMEIQSHIGLKTVPLIARVKGSNTLLNNGTDSNELTLEIACTKSGDSVKLSTKTRFTLIADDELFGTLQNRMNAVATTVGLNAQTNNEGAERSSFAFEVQREDLQIEAGKPIFIQITNFISDASNGAYNLLLQYEGIPGYWDGAWVIPIEFDPLVIRDGKVGIGTDQPTANLHVKGTINLENDNGSFNTTRPDSDFDFLQNDGSTRRTVSIHGGQQGGNVLEVWGKGSMQQNIPGLSVSNKTGNVGVGTVEPDQKLVVNGRIKDQTGFLMPVGAIIAFGGQKLPDGWLLCDGQTSLNDPKYAELKEALGEGNNEKTPDLRSRFIVGAGQGEGLSNYPIGTGENKGAETHKLTLPEMPKHSHTGSASEEGNHQHKMYHRGFDGDNADGQGATEDSKDNFDDSQVYSGWSGNHSHTITIGESGEDKHHNNLPPYYALTYIIKY